MLNKLSKLSMKHSKADLILVLLLIMQISFLVLPLFISFSHFELFLLIIANVFLMGTNYQCIAHNFIHIPFFRSSAINNVFSILNSIGIGLPQSMYRIHHLNHHRFNNHPDTDESSTYRFGKNGKEENIFKYSLLGVVRTDLAGLYKIAGKQSILPTVEIAVLLIFFGLYFYQDSYLALTYLAPSVIFGQIFAVWENYCEHHRAPLNDRKRDSVSCYNPFYNLLWFNNGYHQEHHYSPQVHWTEVPKIRSQLPEDRIIVTGCHLSNSFKQ